MNSVLAQISVAVGGVFFILALALALSNGVPMLTAVLRAIVVLCIASVSTAVFFRYFTRILYRFVSDRLQETNPGEKPAEPSPPPRPPPHKPG